MAGAGPMGVKIGRRARLASLSSWRAQARHPRLAVPMSAKVVDGAPSHALTLEQQPCRQPAVLAPMRPAAAITTFNGRAGWPACAGSFLVSDGPIHLGLEVLVELHRLVVEERQNLRRVDAGDLARRINPVVR